MSQARRYHAHYRRIKWPTFCQEWTLMASNNANYIIHLSLDLLFIYVFTSGILLTYCSHDNNNIGSAQTVVLGFNLIHRICYSSSYLLLYQDRSSTNPRHKQLYRNESMCIALLYILQRSEYMSIYALCCSYLCIIFWTGPWFTPVSSTNKTDRHDKTERLLIVALYTIKQTKQTNWTVTSIPALC
jgi:hypothetical protein